MRLCEYGCGNEAKYQYKNGKWYCSNHSNSCPKMKEKFKISNKGVEKPKPKKLENNSIILCSHNCGNIAKYQFKNGNYCCQDRADKCPQVIKNRNFTENTSKLLREQKLGPKNPNYGKPSTFKGHTHTKENREYFSKINKNKKISFITRRRMSISSRNTISKIKNKYPLFYRIEEMRYNPDKPNEKEIQVHCKNHNCPNSKEHNGWFTPHGGQITERIRALETEEGSDGSYFYCSDECKDECPLYNLKGDPNKKKCKWYTDEEYYICREEVFRRSKGLCEYCGRKAEHMHHIIPQKINGFFSLDPDYCVSCCSKCHYEKGHKDECSTGQLAILG